MGYILALVVTVLAIGFVYTLAVPRPARRWRKQHGNQSRLSLAVEKRRIRPLRRPIPPAGAAPHF